MSSEHDILVRFQQEVVAQISATERALSTANRYAMDVVSCQTTRLRHLEWQVESLRAENRTLRNEPPQAGEESAAAEKQQDEVTLCKMHLVAPPEHKVHLIASPEHASEPRALMDVGCEEDGHGGKLTPWRDLSKGSDPSKGSTRTPSASNAHVQARVRASRSKPSSSEQGKESPRCQESEDQEATAQNLKAATLEVATPPSEGSHHSLHPEIAHPAHPDPTHHTRQVVEHLAQSTRGAHGELCLQRAAISHSSLESSLKDELEKANRKRSETMMDLYMHGGHIDDIAKQEREHLDRAAQRRKCLENISLTLIVLNTVYMAMEAQFRMQSVVHGKMVPNWLYWGNVTIAITFTAELAAKVALYRSDFCRVNWGWNFFDVFLVVCTLLDVIAEGLNISVFRVLRIVRAVRASRALQTIQYVQQLRLMVASIICSLPSLCWAFVLMLLFLYLMALLIMQGVEEHQRVNGLSEELLDLYGEVSVSMLSLFMAISGGRDWYECVQPLYKVSPLYVIVFVLFVTFVVFGVVNILTAVFIEAASGIINVDRDLVAQRHRQETQSIMRKLQELFEKIDTDHSGMISKAEIIDMFEDPQTVSLLKVLEVEVDQAHDLLGLLQMNGDGEINVGDFVVTMMRIRGLAKGTDLAASLRETRHLFTGLSGDFQVMAQNVDFLMKRPPTECCTCSGEMAGTEIHL